MKFIIENWNEESKKFVIDDYESSKIKNDEDAKIAFWGTQLAGIRCRISRIKNGKKQIILQAKS